MRKELIQECVRKVELSNLSDIALIQKLYETRDIRTAVITENILQNVIKYVKNNKQKVANIVRKSAPMAVLLLLPLLSQGQNISSVLNKQDAEKVIINLSKTIGSNIKLDAENTTYDLSDIKNIIQSQSDSAVYSTLGNLLKFNLADKDKINKIVGGSQINTDNGWELGKIITSVSPELKDTPSEDFFELGKAYMDGDVDNGIFTFKGKKYKVDMTPDLDSEGSKFMSLEEHNNLIKQYIKKVSDTGSGNVNVAKIARGESYLGIDLDTEISLQVDDSFQNRGLGLKGNTLNIQEFAEVIDKLLETSNFRLDTTKYDGVNSEIYSNKIDKSGKYRKVKTIDIYIQTY
jgi:hypothetical protein